MHGRAEAATAQAVKNLIVDTPSVSPQDWELTYSSSGAGGVVSVLSELGEAIHKIHNRGMECWRLFDEKYFSIQDAADREAAILKDRSDIIDQINRDYQKVYFGKNSNGDVVDLFEMTYQEILARIVEICFIVDGDTNRGRFKSTRWVDSGYLLRAKTFAHRIFERFCPHDAKYACIVKTAAFEAPRGA